ncbi:MAG: alpha/beta hydrolase [Parasphingorhabdus sp.]
MIEKRALDWKGCKLAVARKGEGPKALLFIHGNSSCKEAFEDLWGHPELEGFTLIGLDLPGHGESDDAVDPESTYTIPGYAAAAAHVVKELGLDRPVVVGWSLGGHAALEMAVSGKDLAGVFITGTPPVGPGSSLLEGGFTPFTLEQSTGEENPTEQALRDYAAHMYGVPVSQYERFVPALLRTAGRARSRMTEHWMGHNGTCHLEYAKTGDVPLAIAHGDKDPFVDPVFLDNLASPRLWGDKIHHFASSGHAPFLDAPDEFSAQLKNFADDVLGQARGT